MGIVIDGPVFTGYLIDTKICSIALEEDEVEDMMWFYFSPVQGAAGYLSALLCLRDPSGKKNDSVDYFCRTRKYWRSETSSLLSATRQPGRRPQTFIRGLTFILVILQAAPCLLSEMHFASAPGYSSLR